MKFFSALRFDIRLCVTLLAVAVSVPAAGQRFCDVMESSPESLRVAFSVPVKLDVGTVSIKGVEFNAIAIEGLDLSSEIGSPSLPTLREWIEVPVCGRVGVEVIRVERVVIDGDSVGVTLPVMPRQPSVCKTDSRNADMLVVNSDVYTRDEFVGADIASVCVVGTARDRRLAHLVLSPVRYNPVANQFVIYTSVELRLTFEDIDHEATKALLYHRSPAFSSGVETINDLNASNACTPKNTGSQAIRCLIVSHPMFREALAEFVDWKRSVGYLVDTVFTGTPEVGSTVHSIASYIRSQYTSATDERPAPTFLILVGDTAQLPASNYSYYMSYYGYMDHVSDLDYACWTPGDNLPDCHYGRLSAQNVAQLRNQLQKILMYERYEFPDPTFLDKALLVAGIDGGSAGDYGYSHADPAMDYAATMYMNGYNGFSSVKEFKNNTSITPHVANVSVLSNAAYNEEYIRSLYSEGAGWINYSAHGDWNRWYSPQMTNDHVSDMSNTKRFGVMIGNCCLTAKFDEPTCFAEALMRVGNYCGAAAYIGGSNSTYWFEDFYWSVGIRPVIGGGMSHEYRPASRGAYDWLFHTHGEPHSQWATSLGALLMSGNMAVEHSSSHLNSYYWQIYHLFGDPSMMPWLSQAKEMPLSYSGADEGSTLLYVTTAPYAYVAVTDSGHALLGAAFAGQNGRATLRCSQPIEYGNANLSSLAQGYIPLVRAISQPEGIGNPELGVRHLALSAYPNPTAGHLTIENAARTAAYIYNSLGRCVLSFGLDVGTNEVDLSTLPQGVYILKTADGRIAKIARR